MNKFISCHPQHVKPFPINHSLAVAHTHRAGQEINTLSHWFKGRETSFLTSKHHRLESRSSWINKPIAGNPGLSCCD